MIIDYKNDLKTELSSGGGKTILFEPFTFELLPPLCSSVLRLHTRGSISSVKDLPKIRKLPFHASEQE
jgi:hypothetical protein